MRGVVVTRRVGLDITVGITDSVDSLKEPFVRQFGLSLYPAQGLFRQVLYNQLFT